MPAQHPTEPSLRSEGAETEQTRFIIFGGARTGSNMLVSALNSSPEIICFRELFRFMDDSIDFGVAGYDDDSTADLELRNRDYSAFLDQRIFVRTRGAVAVGFKVHDSHFYGFAGLREWLVEQQDIRILHLRRRNLLRMLVSTEIAKATGEWIDPVGPGLLQIFRHPARSAARLLGSLRPKPAEPTSQRGPITLSAQECRDFFLKTEIISKQYDQLFSEHHVQTIYYEDLIADLRGTLDSAQEFLGAAPRPLNIGTNRQNLEPLEALLSNYAELRSEFMGTPCEPFFD